MWKGNIDNGCWLNGPCKFRVNICVRESCLNKKHISFNSIFFCVLFVAIVVAIFLNQGECDIVLVIITSIIIV